MSSIITPRIVKPFMALGFDYQPNKVSSTNAFGPCPFCDKKDKFYVNINTGQWDCKVCTRQGNVYAFMHMWHTFHLGVTQDTIIRALANERKLPFEAFEGVGIAYADGKYWVPVRNQNSALVNLRSYSPGKGFMNLAGMEAQLFGAEYIMLPARAQDPVYICEGEWDAIALRHMLETNGSPGIVLGAPGANVWRDIWATWLRDRDVVICYDNDEAGYAGRDRVAKHLYARQTPPRVISWPTDFPDKYDVRDFVVENGDLGEFLDLVMPFTQNAEITLENYIPGVSLVKNKPIYSDDDFKLPRPKFAEVVRTFANHLHMTEDMTDALRVIFATVLSNQIQGEPLWMHIVAPPGSAKTELLMPLSASDECYFASTLTAHSLVSGWQTQDGSDPSLLPKLDGKTFVLKDYTEILNLPAIAQDEINATLRGAFDGSVCKQFGNGLVREYNIKFNMLTGVTHAVFGKRGSSLGERFLMFHLTKGVGFSAGDAIRAAIGNVGKESEFRYDLAQMVRRFLHHIVQDFPETPDWFIDKVVNLSALVGMLRACVERVYTPGAGAAVTYRPQHEMGTRLAKQFTKLAYGLALVSDHDELGEDEYRIIMRVAMDTCIGFNLETVGLLAHTPKGLGLQDICDELELPYTTINEQLNDLVMLGICYKIKDDSNGLVGAPKNRYFITQVVNDYWIGAGLDDYGIHEILKSRRHIEKDVKVSKAAMRQAFKSEEIRIPGQNPPGQRR